MEVYLSIEQLLQYSIGTHIPRKYADIVMPLAP
jgi:hypothetical protein